MFVVAWLPSSNDLLCWHSKFEVHLYHLAALGEAWALLSVKALLLLPSLFVWDSSMRRWCTLKNQATAPTFDHYFTHTWWPDPQRQVRKAGDRCAARLTELCWAHASRHLGQIKAAPAAQLGLKAISHACTLELATPELGYVCRVECKYDAVWARMSSQ